MFYTTRTSEIFYSFRLCNSTDIDFLNLNSRFGVTRKPANGLLLLWLSEAIRSDKSPMIYWWKHRLICKSKSWWGFNHIGDQHLRVYQKYFKRSRNPIWGIKILTTSECQTRPKQMIETFRVRSTLLIGIRSSSSGKQIFQCQPSDAFPKIRRLLVFQFCGMKYLNSLRIRISSSIRITLCRRRCRNSINCL